MPPNPVNITPDQKDSKKSKKGRRKKKKDKDGIMTIEGQPS